MAVVESRSSKAVCATPRGDSAPGVTVESVDPRREPDWDEWTDALEGWGPFHSAGWAQVLADTYGFTPMYLVAKGDGRVVGLLPLMEAKSFWKGTRGVSLPFTDTCAVLAEKPEIRAGLVRRALDLYRERSWKYLELRDGTVVLPEGAQSDEYVEHVLSLEPPEDRLWEGCHSSARRAVRKAETSGVTASIEHSLESVREYYSLHLQTRKSHGVPPQPWGFFANLQRNVIGKGGGLVSLARLDGRPVAGSVFLIAGDRAVFKYGASDPRDQSVRGNNLTMWEGIRACHAAGCKTLSFGRTDIGQEGLRRFKRNWGASEQEVKYFRLQRGPGETAQRHSEGGGWAATALKHCPIPVARLAGSLLYRHMA